LEEEEERLRRKEEGERKKREDDRLMMMAAAEEAKMVKEARLAKEKEEEQLFRDAMLQKFAEEDKLEQMSAQRRRMKQNEHKREVERLMEERRKAYEEQRMQEAAEREITPEQAQKLAENAKGKGNKAQAAKDYKSAVRHYTMAINMDKTNGVYYSNRSASHCGLGDWNSALEDAHKCTELKPDWPKGYGRVGFAFKGLRCYNLAIEAYEKSQELEPNDKTLELIAELVQKRDDAGFTKEQETETLKQQAKAEQQRQMADAGCVCM